MTSRDRDVRFESKLAGYCAAAGATLFMASAANAGVVFTNVADDVISTGNTYSIDFDGGGTDDITFPSSGWSSKFAQVTSGSVLGSSSGNDNALALSKGYVISSGRTNWMTGADFWSSGYYYNSTYGTTSYYSYGNWAGASNKYLGVQFNIGANTHYGWVELSANAAKTQFTVHGYAYETTPDGAIAAGAVPEPGSLALFALGAAGLAAWRIRRKKRD